MPSFHCWEWACSNLPSQSQGPRGVKDEVIKRTWPPADPRAGPGQLEAPHPHPWNVHSAHFPECELFQGHSFERAHPTGAIWMGYMTEPCWGLCINFKILEGRCGDLLLLRPPKTSLACKFPCLLNLPPTNLECLPLSLVSPCPACLWTNTIIWFLHPPLPMSAKVPSLTRRKDKRSEGKEREERRGSRGTWQEKGKEGEDHLSPWLHPYVGTALSCSPPPIAHPSGHCPGVSDLFQEDISPLLYKAVGHPSPTLVPPKPLPPGLVVLHILSYAWTRPLSLSSFQSGTSVNLQEEENPSVVIQNGGGRGTNCFLINSITIQCKNNLYLLNTFLYFLNFLMWAWITFIIREGLFCVCLIKHMTFWKVSQEPKMFSAIHMLTFVCN